MRDAYTIVGNLCSDSSMGSESGLLKSVLELPALADSCVGCCDPDCEEGGGARLSRHASVAHSKQRVFPVPVGLSSRAFFPWNQ